MKVLAHAKLNLSLGVTGRREDGFHEINSIMTGISIADKIEVRLKKIPEITVVMKGCSDIKQEENTAYLMACKFFEQFKLTDIGAEIKIEKNIPIMAGLGGSSADAAGVLYCLASLCGIIPTSNKVYNLAASCGSDTLAMMIGGVSMVEGRGELVTRLPIALPMVFVVAVGEKCSTKKVFEKYDEMPMSQGFNCQNLLKTIKTNFADVFQQCAQNDLTDACCEAYPLQRTFIQRCTDLIGQRPVMSGSGGGVFWPVASEYVAIRMVKKLRKNGITAFLCTPTQDGVVSE